MELECFSTSETPPEMVPGRPQRAWMDSFLDRHPYRCLPLTMANTTGWELLCPVGVTAEWNGGVHQDDIKITVDSKREDLNHFAKSHFSHGILTFHPGYLFRTPPGWSMWVGGPHNSIKDGIQALTGLVETDWLPFPFTMNWAFTRPGRIRFEKGEPFCFLTVGEDKKMEEVQPVIRSLESDPPFNAQYEAWLKQRHDFNEKIYKGDPKATKESWQRFYFKGELPDETGPAPKVHTNKRRLKAPRLGR